jgi:hypothetical protein
MMGDGIGMVSIGEFFQWPDCDCRVEFIRPIN